MHAYRSLLPLSLNPGSVLFEFFWHEAAVWNDSWALSGCKLHPRVYLREDDGNQCSCGLYNVKVTGAFLQHALWGNGYDAIHASRSARRSYVIPLSDVGSICWYWRAKLEDKVERRCHFRREAHIAGSGALAT